ncbi:hypothetical protein M758_5G037000 [Ceratodon purpureus]|nr:hypothetical protein M758_5G037000 [Ceratodon purpureus]
MNSTTNSKKTTMTSTSKNHKPTSIPPTSQTTSPPSPLLTIPPQSSKTPTPTPKLMTLPTMEWQYNVVERIGASAEVEQAPTQMEKSLSWGGSLPDKEARRSCHRHRPRSLAKHGITCPKPSLGGFSVAFVYPWCRFPE